MLRPTLNEMILGIQRAIVETLLPELQSPYAQSQAVTCAGVLGYISASLSSTLLYDDAEIEDLRATLAAVLKVGRDSPDGLSPERRIAIEAALGAAGDKRAMENAMAELASDLVLGRLGSPIDSMVRGYLGRNLERMRVLLAPGLVARG
jgi:hypothetical protein